MREKVLKEVVGSIQTFFLSLDTRIDLENMQVRGLSQMSEYNVIMPVSCGYVADALCCAPIDQDP